MSATITDDALIRAAYDGTESERRYSAVYLDGRRVSFAVRNLIEARQYAREYGVRFLGGARVVSVEVTP